MNATIKKIILEAVRIGLRYFGLYLIMRGVYVDEGNGFFNDPAVVELLGGTIIAVTESFFVRAKLEEIKA